MIQDIPHVHFGRKIGFSFLDQAFQLMPEESIIPIDQGDQFSFQFQGHWDNMTIFRPEPAFFWNRFPPTRGGDAYAHGKTASQ